MYRNCWILYKPTHVQKLWNTVQPTHVQKLLDTVQPNHVQQWLRSPRSPTECGDIGFKRFVQARVNGGSNYDSLKVESPELMALADAEDGTLQRRRKAGKRLMSFPSCHEASL